MTTTNLAKFGSRERKMAEELLKAWRKQGLPEDFYNEYVTIMMNQDSDNVFLTNADCQVAMMNGDKLESFYSCPHCGHKGFLEDMEHEPEDEECSRYLEEIKEVEMKKKVVTCFYCQDEKAEHIRKVAVRRNNGFKLMDLDAHLCKHCNLLDDKTLSDYFSI